VEGPFEAAEGSWRFAWSGAGRCSASREGWGSEGEVEDR
jgi:hypothetical protein